MIKLHLQLDLANRAAIYQIEQQYLTEMKHTHYQQAEMRCTFALFDIRIIPQSDAEIKNKY